MPPGGGLKVIDKKQVDRCAPDRSEDRYHFGISGFGLGNLGFKAPPRGQGPLLVTLAQNRMNAERAIL